MKFKNYTEALDNPYKFKETKSNSKIKEITFVTDAGAVYTVILETMQSGEITYLSVLFEDKDESFFMTNTGDAFRVLATVKAVLINQLSFLKTFEIIKFVGFSLEPSRIKLFKRLSKIMGKALNKKVTIKNGAFIAFYLSNDLEKVKEIS